MAAAPSNRGYDGGFATAMMLKDLKLAQDAAAQLGGRDAAGRPGRGALRPVRPAWATADKDFSAVLQLLRGRLGDLS